MAQYLFGAGKIFATPLQDVHGNPIANGTPVEVGVLQSTSVDISYDLKELYGRGQFAVDAARGKGSIKCKATMGRINGVLLNSIFFGGVVTEGGITAVAQTINGEVVAASVTPVVPNSGTFVKDLGVTDAKAIPLKRVVSAPVAGQYSVDEATGVYTFASADVGKTVFISFKYCLLCKVCLSRKWSCFKTESLCPGVIETVPEEVCTSPDRILRKVDLPAPLAPIRETISPFLMCTLTSVNAAILP